MAKSTATCTDLLNEFFNAVALPWAAGSNLYISLHTADPTAGGNQNSSEVTYTGHNRVAVLRTSAGWTVAGAQVSNTALIQFVQCSGGTNTITHVAIGTLSSGAGQILYSGALNSPLSVSSGIQPQFAASALVVTES